MIMQTILFRDAHPRRSRRNLTESTQQIEALGSGTMAPNKIVSSFMY
jgi:hypothetical protein